MKVDPYQKKSAALFFSLSLVITIVDVYFIVFRPLTLQHLLPLNIFFVVFALFLACSRVSAKPCHTVAGKRLPVLRWLFAIFFIEGLSLLFFVNILQTSQLFLNSEIIPLTVQVPAAAQITHWLLLDWGIFPFALIAILAAGLAYMYYQQHQAATVAALLPNIKKTYYNLFIKRVLNGFIGAVSNFVIIISVSVGLLSLGRLLLMAMNINDIAQIRIGTFVFFLVITGLSTTKVIRWMAVTFSQVFRKREAVAILLYMVIALLIFLLSYLLALPIYHFMQGYVLLPDFSHLNHRSHLQVHWQLLIWAWWVCWSPLLASAIARVSCGYSMRAIIFATLLLPITVAVATVYHITVPGLMLVAHAIFHAYWLSVLGPFVLIAVLMKNNGSKLLVFGFMPVCKQGVAVHTHKPIEFVRSTLQSTIVLMGAFLIRNVYGLQLLTLLAAIPNAIFFMVLSLLFYKNLLHQRRYKQD